MSESISNEDDGDFRHIIESVMSKTDYDFSCVEGWNDFLKERTRQVNRTDDGLQLVDLKIYPVGFIPYFSSGKPIPVNVNIRTQGQGLALPPGVFYLYYPDENNVYRVKTSFIGPPSQTSCSFYFEIAGSGTSTRPYWGGAYYIALKTGDIPGKKVAETTAKKVLKEGLKNARSIVKNGTKTLFLGGAYYIIDVYIQNEHYSSSFCNEVESCLPQNALSKKDLDVIFETAKKNYGKL